MKNLSIAIITCVLTLYVVGAFLGSRTIETHYVVGTNKITKDYRVVQISDYHSTENAKDKQKILEIVRENNPDIIALTGDMLESESYTSTIDFISKLFLEAPVVYARGNHDDQFGTYEDFKMEMQKIGVVILEDQNYQFGELNIIGIDDIDRASLLLNDDFKTYYESKVIDKSSSLINSNAYNILLAHRPNFFEEYEKIGSDLVFSGHAHGGQWQIPFTDIGVLAPDDGLFTNNVHGMKSNGEMIQIISSGTSNPYGPWIPRLFNPKEVVVVDLVTQTEEK